MEEVSNEIIKFENESSLLLSSTNMFKWDLSHHLQPQFFSSPSKTQLKNNWYNNDDNDDADVDPYNDVDDEDDCDKSDRFAAGVKSRAATEGRKSSSCHSNQIGEKSRHDFLL